MSFKPPGQCPVCGEWVPRGAVACDDCGACAKSGWKEDADVYDGVDLPDDPHEFDYDAFVESEFGSGRQPGQMPSVWRWTALALLAAIILALVLSARR